jgi:AraC-like DNA-binding protein
MVPFTLDCRPGIIRTERWTVQHGVIEYVKPFWALHFPHYHMEFTIYGKTHQIHPGHAVLSPPNVLNTPHYPGRAHHYFAHFEFNQEQFNCAQKLDVPLVIDLGDDYFKLNEHFKEVVELYRVSVEQAEISFWHLLCRLYGVQPRRLADLDYPAHIVNALIYVQENLGARITVETMAEYAGVSVGYLTNEFKKHLQKTPAKYILDKRMSEACNLLLTTNFMIKEVAIDVGINDPQHFNKLIKKYFGMPPGELRKAGESGFSPDM